MTNLPHYMLETSSARNAFENYTFGSWLFLKVKHPTSDISVWRGLYLLGTYCLPILFFQIGALKEEMKT